MVNVNAAKESQNGMDHSLPSVAGRSFWSSNPANVDNTITLVRYFADRYKDEGAFLGLGLLNEPFGNTTRKVLYDYYKRAYQSIRATGNDCVLTVAPMLLEQDAHIFWNFMLPPAYSNVWVEWHPYFRWGVDNVADEVLVNTSVKIEFQFKLTRWNSRPCHNRLYLGKWSFATNNKFQNYRDLFYEFAAAQLKVLNQAEGG
ncbi:hypothetical protein CCR75_006252 [Bremia lactucae]|uniref:glucan 1,3-beta-glucosidase n=1 Tax=Bremia lactucae TaxID=4779 RepID=A0A976FN57_BRELC|nr:hypothetical protein CCR75_006252 [Bremia lactucae]